MPMELSFGSPLSILLGSFAVSTDELNQSDENVPNERPSDEVEIVTKFASAIKRVLHFVEQDPNLSSAYWRPTLCYILQQLTFRTKSCGSQNSSKTSTNHELQTVLTYLEEFLPEITEQNFFEICYEVDFYAELGTLLFDSAEMLFKITESVEKSLENESDLKLGCLAVFTFHRWKASTLSECCEDIPLSVVNDVRVITELTQGNQSRKELFIEGIVNELKKSVENLKLSLQTCRIQNDKKSYLKPLPVDMLKETTDMKKLIAVIIYVKFEFIQLDMDCLNSVQIEFDKFCVIAGFPQLIFSEEKAVIDALLLDGYTKLDLARNSVQYNLSDARLQLCFILEYFTTFQNTISNEEFDEVYNLIETYLPSFCRFEVMRVVMDLCLVPGSNLHISKTGADLMNDPASLLRVCFFDNLTNVPFDCNERLRCYLFDQLSACEFFEGWSRNIADVMGLTFGKMTELFNRLSPKDLQEKTPTMQFLSHCSFVIPHKIIEKAVNDAFASRGKTMLIQQLFQKLPSLLKFSHNSEKRPFVLKVIAETNVSNTNSACQFVRFITVNSEITVDEMFVHGVLPKFVGNKVNAVKLLVALQSQLNNDKALYVSVLNKFFNASSQVTLDLSDPWTLEFAKTGFEELKTDCKSNFDIDFRRLMIECETSKYLALVEFFSFVCLSLPKIGYDQSKITVINIPEFTVYTLNEASLCAFKFITSGLNALDVRAFAVSLKLLIKLSLIDRKGSCFVSKSENMLVWQIIVKSTRLCLSCEELQVPPSLLESLTTIVKGVLKWLKQETGENPGVVGRYDLFYFCLHMLNDVLLCCVLTTRQQEVFFRDCFYLLIDQVQILCAQLNLEKNSLKGDSETSDEQVVTWNVVQSFFNDQVCKSAKICTYSLPVAMSKFINAL